jgi:hypothetical protein
MSIEIFSTVKCLWGFHQNVSTKYEREVKRHKHMVWSRKKKEMCVCVCVC